jgi:hypothetical protein
MMITLKGRFKGEVDKRWHIVPICDETQSGIPFRLWMERILNRCVALQGRTLCVCVFRPPVKGELLLDMRYQSLAFTSMMSPPYPRSQLYYSSGSPGGLAREVSDEAVVSRM